MGIRTALGNEVVKEKHLTDGIIRLNGKKVSGKLPLDKIEGEIKTKTGGYIA